MTVPSAVFRINEDVDLDGVVQLGLLGELDLAVTDGLARRLRELGRASKAVRLDLSQLSFIDSSGIRTLVNAVEDAEQNGWTLEIDSRLTRQVERVIKLTGVDSLFWPTSHE
jgi:anti-sigma B factor antagonist